MLPWRAHARGGELMRATEKYVRARSARARHSERATKKCARDPCEKNKH